MLPDKQKQAYAGFYESAWKNDILDPKTTPVDSFGCSHGLWLLPLNAALPWGRQEGRG